jgi:hypothetical protein
MTERAARLRRAPIYGIGRYTVGSDYFDFEIGWPEFDRDVAWARSLLTQSGIGANDMVLITAGQCEAPWISPVVRALKDLNATCLVAEVFGFDAGRSAWFLQSFPVKAVIGLGRDTVDGWAEKDLSPTELLKDVHAVWARPDAAPLLKDIGSTVAPFVMLGPALAMGIPGGGGAKFDPAEWRVHDNHGRLSVSTVANRAAQFDEAPTGLCGEVITIDGGMSAVHIADPTPM